MTAIYALVASLLSKQKKKNEPTKGSFYSRLVRMTGLVVSKANVIAKRANLFATVKRQLHKGRLQTKFADNAIYIVASPSPQYKEKRTPMVRLILVWCG